MTDSNHILMTACVTIIAFLYSSVGHAGASGYVAVMALFGLAPPVVKPTALILNILVATIGSWQFYRSGHFSWRLFYPFALLSVPMAFVGGYFNLPSHLFKPLLGIILWFSAGWFLIRPEEIKQPQPPALPTALGAGASIGLLAGLTGTGGGIFLTPLAILMQWGQVKPISAIAAVFILVNSLAGLIGYLSSAQTIPAVAPWLALAAIGGGLTGSYLGSAKFPPTTIKRILAIVLAIAGYKLIFS
jgi:uncharacterized protein